MMGLNFIEQTEREAHIGRMTYLCILGTFLSAILLSFLTETVLTVKRTQRPPTRTEMEQAISLVVFNLSWLGLATCYVAGPILEACLDDIDAKMPSALVVCFQVAFFLVVDDIWFYFYHRLVHAVPWLYRTMHKRHHTFTAPFPAVAFAVHPLEIIFISFGTCLGPLVFMFGRTHPKVFWLWLVLRQLQVIEDHLGFEVQYSPARLLPKLLGGTKFHDLHHQYFRGNYAATFSVLDRLFGTEIPQDHS